MYEELVRFVRDECARRSQLSDLQGQIPSAVLKGLKTKINEEDQLNVIKQDAVCKRIYDLESEWRKSKIKEITELIGDIPKYSIGTQIQDTDSGISIDKLVEDVSKLPNMGMFNPGADEADKSSKVLTEYTNLREDLIEKCQAITLGKQTVLDLENQARMIRYLINSTVEENSEYFETYHSKVSNSLEELRLLLEEAIKSSDSQPEKRLKLRKVLDNF